MDSVFVPPPPDGAGSPGRAGQVNLLVMDRERLERERGMLQRRGRMQSQQPGRTLTHRFLQGLYGWWKSSQMYVHVEVSFGSIDWGPRGRPSSSEEDESSDDEEPDVVPMVAYTVYEETGVTKGDRVLRSDAYSIIQLPCTEQQQEASRAFCESQLGKPMDMRRCYVSMVWPVAPMIGGDGEPTGWWCSALVCAALHRAGYMTSYRPQSVDIDDIVHYALSSSLSTQTTTPFKQRAGARSFWDRTIAMRAGRGGLESFSNFTPDDVRRASRAGRGKRGRGSRPGGAERARGLPEFDDIFNE